MKTIQLNKLAMYDAVRAFLANATEIQGHPVLSPKLIAFYDKLDELKNLTATQSQPLGAAIATRDEALRAAANAALTIAGIVLSYADENRLGSLALRVRVRPSDFKHTRLIQRVQLAQQIHDAAVGAIDQLESHGLTSEMLHQFQEKIWAAAEALSVPRNVVGAKRAATEQIVAIVREVDAILGNRIDPLLLPFRETNPAFYAHYQAVRMIVDRRGSRTAATPASENANATLPSAHPLAERKAA